jgi:hypothetical protein
MTPPKLKVMESLFVLTSYLTNVRVEHLHTGHLQVRRARYRRG